MSLITLMLSTAFAFDIGVGLQNDFSTALLVDAPQLMVGTDVGHVHLEFNGSYNVHPEEEPWDVLSQIPTSRVQVARDTASIAFRADWNLAPPVADRWWVTPALVGGAEIRAWQTITMELHPNDALTREAGSAQYAFGPVVGLAMSVHIKHARLRLSMLDHTVLARRPLLFVDESEIPLRLEHTPTLSLDVAWAFGGQS